MRRITEFEGLRAILAWWVVWGHILQVSGFTADKLNPLIRWIEYPGLAVDVFIILSGFVIFFLLDNQRGKSFFRFIVERFFRLYPLFLVTLVLAIISVPLAIFVMTHGSWNDPEFAATALQRFQNGQSHLVAYVLPHLFMIHGIFPNEILPNSSLVFLSPTWSISLEWQFYLIAPLLFSLLRKSLLASVAVFGFLIISKKFFSDLSFDKTSFLPLSMELFTIGILSYYFYRYIQENHERFIKYFPFTATASIVVSALLAFAPYGQISSKAVPLTIWLIALNIAISSFIKTQAKPFHLASNLLNNSWLQKLGAISYSTYLIHVLVLRILMWLSIKFIPDVDQEAVLIILGSIGSMMITIASFASYNWIEKLFIKLGKQISKRMAARAVTT